MSDAENWPFILNQASTDQNCRPRTVHLSICPWWRKILDLPFMSWTDLDDVRPWRPILHNTFESFGCSIWKSKRWNHTSRVPDWIYKIPIFWAFNIAFHHSNFWNFIQVVHLINFFDKWIELIFRHDHQFDVFTSKIIKIKFCQWN